MQSPQSPQSRQSIPAPETTVTGRIRRRAGIALVVVPVLAGSLSGSLAGTALGDELRPTPPAAAGLAPAAQQSDAERRERPRAQPPAFPSGDPEATRAEKEQELRERLIPPAMTKERLDALPDLLGMSEEDRARFAVVRDAYVEASKAARSRERGVLRVLPAAFRYDSVDAAFEPVYTPVHLAAVADVDSMHAAIARAEAEFAVHLDRLADGSKRGLWRVLRVTRLQEVHGRPVRLPGARVNLLELLPKAGLTQDEFELLGVHLDRYATELARAIVARDDEMRDIDRERRTTLVELGPEWRAGQDLESARSTERAIARFDALDAQTEFELRALNFETLERIRRALPPQTARRVVVSWQSQVHPELFEDERILRLSLEAFAALPTATPDEIGAAADLLLQTESVLWPLGQRAVDLADGIVVANQFPPTDAAAARILLEADLQKLLIKRRANVRDALRRLGQSMAAPDTTSSDDPRTAFAARLEDALAAIDAQDQAGRFLVAELEARAEELRTIIAAGLQPGTEIGTDNDVPQPTEVADDDAAPTPETVPVGDAANGQPGAENEQPPPTQQDRERNGRGTRRR
jgi:hypothetical protein